MTQLWVCPGFLTSRFRLRIWGRVPWKGCVPARLLVLPVPGTACTVQSEALKPGATSLVSLCTGPWFQPPCSCRAPWGATASALPALFWLFPKHPRSLRCTCRQGCVEAGPSSRKQLLRPSWVLFREHEAPTLDEFLIHCCTSRPARRRGQRERWAPRVPRAHARGVGFQEVLPARSSLPSQGPYLSVNVQIPRFVARLAP